MDHKTRTEPPRLADERTMLDGFLQYQRETLALKCSGLTPEQLKNAAAPPSNLSLLGLVRHLTDVERGWFGKVQRDEEVVIDVLQGNFDEDAVFDVTDADSIKAFKAWHEVCSQSRIIVSSARSLDDRAHEGEDVYSLRYILIHLIEEYARHNGHADLLRERIDGTTGE